MFKLLNMKQKFKVGFQLGFWNVFNSKMSMTVSIRFSVSISLSISSNDNGNGTRFFEYVNKI